MPSLSGLADSVITDIVSAAMDECQVPYLCLNLLSVFAEKEVSALGRETELFLASGI